MNFDDHVHGRWLDLSAGSVASSVVPSVYLNLIRIAIYVTYLYFTAVGIFVNQSFFSNGLSQLLVNSGGHGLAPIGSS